MARDEPDAERAAIERTVLDYFEGWFGGDPVRMERALHSELVKRSLESDPTGRTSLRTIDAEQMVEATARGDGRREHPGDLRMEIEIEDVLGRRAPRRDLALSLINLD
jgi:hypothetical protein